MLMQHAIPEHLVKAQAMIDEAKRNSRSGHKAEPTSAPHKPSGIENLHANMKVAIDARSAKNKAIRADLAVQIKPFVGDLSAAEIAAKLGKSQGLVRKAAKEHGLDLNIGSGKGRRPGRAGPTDEQIKQMRLSAAGGSTINDAAQWIGVSRGTVQLWAIKYAITFGNKR